MSTALVLPEPAPVVARAARDTTRGPILAGLAVMLLFFGGFVTFAALAPLSGAVVAGGTIKVEGNRQAVQHPDGGVVRDLRVREGDRVESGQVLIQLDTVAAKARVETLQAERDTLKALEARYLAERGGAAGPSFDASLTQRRAKPSVAEAMTNQTAVFRERRNQFAAETDVRRQKIKQLDEEIKGHRIEIEGLATQLALIEDELAGVRQIYDKGFAPKTRVVSLARTQAQLISEKGTKLAAIAGAQQQIGETNLVIIAAERTRATETAEGLRNTQGKLTELEPKLTTAREVLDRTTIRSPTEGRVVELNAFTVGGVIAAGSRVLDIVPSKKELLIEARIPPENIDEVAAGMRAEVRFTGVAQKRRPIATGRVVTVSADRIDDMGTSGGHYTAQVKLDPNDLAARNVTLQAGMPAQVVVSTYPRTILDYLVAPLSDQVERVFREE
ncbi:HlyD family type I secretion periplasmic adaptor subunit [Methylobacterium terricola]|uniref:Membrane fusion protein (MFP) family protein n=1 Tax=Methylobacterium terricola TaxID=2583531 RepID=A0A5C4L8U1_9HYPH|nr:HlyD family type I secretion periplasmic adaptor subunit [Methylobacterium terricola]TNC08765.1 HlyD family type I secretion periplasmic adaptor subunit [Methylobacterium terricola]